MNCKNCGRRITDRAIRCRSCESKRKIEENVTGFKSRNKIWQKRKTNGSAKGRKHTKEELDKMRCPDTLVRHHLFYSKINSNAGVILITKNLHRRIHNYERIFEEASNPWFTLPGVNKPVGDENRWKP